MSELTSQKLLNIIERFPIAGDRIANIFIRIQEYRLASNRAVTDDQSMFWYRINRNASRMPDHAKMSLKEREWFLLYATSEQREKMIDIMNKIGSVGNYAASENLPKIKKLYKKGLVRDLNEYISGLESAKSNPGYHGGRELASTEIRESFFRSCLAETEGFTRDITEGSYLAQRIELAKIIAEDRMGPSYQLPQRNFNQFTLKKST